MKEKVIIIPSSPIELKILRRPPMPLYCRAPLEESLSQEAMVGIDQFGTMEKVNIIDLLQNTYTPKEYLEDGGT